MSLTRKQIMAVMMNGGGGGEVTPSDFPAGYTRLDYVTNIPTCIKTGITSVGSTWEVDVQMDSAPSSTQIIICSDDNGGHYFGSSTSAYTIGGGNDFSQAVTARSLFQVVFTSGTSISVTCNGTTLSRTGTNSNSSQVLLFNGGATKKYQFSGKVYSVKCTAGGSFNGVPAKRNSDNMEGLYDLANDVFYAFRDLPTGYSECEYLESTHIPPGLGAYIDTGVNPTSECRIVAKFENSVFVGDYKFLFGCRGANNTSRLECFASDNVVQYPVFSSSNFGTSYYTTSSSPHTLDINKNRFIYDGVEYQSSDTGSWTSTINLVIGALNSNGSYQGSFPFKCYYFKMYNGNTLVRDFVPAYQTSSGKYGLYDLVTSTFYASANTGEGFTGLIKS